MLRPERMSRVSVTGSKRVMDDVIETVHDLNSLDVTDYDGAWEGFDPGNPIAGADEASDRLVTVRSLQSILDVDEEDAGPTRLVTEEALDGDLEETRVAVNDLDDRRDELEDELRAVEERIDAVEPFVDLDLDLDLLSGYDHLTVAVGEGDADAVRDALSDADEIADYEMFSGDEALAVFATPPDAPLDEVLVSVAFTAVEVPDAEGSPEEYVSELRHRSQEVESKLHSVEDELDELKSEVAGFLLAAEETLAIEVQKREAPLTFATTENAFVAEGWLPTGEVNGLADALVATVGDRVAVEELERASYDGEGQLHDREEVEGGAPTGEPVATDGTGIGGEGASDDSDGVSGTDGESDADEDGSDEDDSETQQVVPDGGHVRDDPMSGGEPPVVQDNPDPVGPFETLTRAVKRPRYTELDPTIILFLTLPLFFGLMIGDVGYGIIYMVLGAALVTRFDSEALTNLGYVFVLSGIATVIFGILYGEILGTKIIADVLWNGHPPLHKGVEAHHAAWAKLWLVVAVLFGLAHLTIGYVFDFIDRLQHGLGEAVLESGSWLLLMLGLWTWIFSHHLEEPKPEFLFTVLSGHPVSLGFDGFPVVVGLVGIGVAVVGLVLLGIGEGAPGLVESINVLTHVLSYTRLTAEILAEVALALVVNLLVFGGEGFPGLFNMFGVVGVILGILLFVVGHLLVVAIGILSAGMQAIRLEYVEFFQKFYYEAGGEPYSPFGYDRQFTTED